MAYLCLKITIEESNTKRLNRSKDSTNGLANILRLSYEQKVTA